MGFLQLERLRVENVEILSSDVLLPRINEHYFLMTCTVFFVVPATL